MLTTAIRPNWAMAKERKVKSRVKAALRARCPCFFFSVPIRRSTAFTQRVTMPEIMFTAVEIAPRIISREIMGVSTPAPTPFCTSTSMGTEAVASSATYATASSPTMDSSMAKKFHTNIQMAARLICFTSVTGSTWWYITFTAEIWNRAYRMADQRAGPKAPLSWESTVISPLLMVETEAVMLSHWAMMLGTSTSTSPMIISTLRVEAHRRTTLVPNRATKKINAATTRVQSQ